MKETRNTNNLRASLIFMAILTISVASVHIIINPINEKRYQESLSLSEQKIRELVVKIEERKVNKGESFMDHFSEPQEDELANGKTLRIKIETTSNMNYVIYGTVPTFIRGRGEGRPHVELKYDSTDESLKVSKTN